MFVLLFGRPPVPKFDSDAGVALGDPRGRKQTVSALSVFLIVFSVWCLVWARSARRNLILTRAVSFGSAWTETAGECPLPIFPIVR